MEEKCVFLSPSLLSCDFGSVSKQLEILENAGVKHLHLDVMDGIFVPNISFGIPVIKSIRKSTNMIFDTHLMIDRPERYIDAFIKAGSDYVTIHAEATEYPARVLKDIRAKGAKAGISLKPKTKAGDIFELLPLCDIILVMTVEPGFGGQTFMADMLPKIKEIRHELDRISSPAILSVDGGIDKDTAPLVVEAGANMLVAGSAVFGKEDIAKAAMDILNSVK